RLRLVVARVPKSDDTAAQPQPGSLEKRMARRAPRILERLSLAPCALRNIFAVDHDRPAERFRQPHAKSLVIVSSGTELMIEMSKPCSTQFASRVKHSNDVRERDRVGAARQRDGDESGLPGEAVQTVELTNAIDQLHSLERRERQAGGLVPEGG